jgi:hypothetical protein
VNVLGNHKARSKSKPKPKLNIQIASKGKDKLQVEARYNTILKELKEEIPKLGGRIRLTSTKNKKLMAATKKG